MPESYKTSSYKRIPWMNAWLWVGITAAFTVIGFVGMVVCALVLSRGAKDPGPQTLALAQRMRLYDGRPTAQFLQEFGGADDLSHFKYNGSDILTMTYACKEGCVEVDTSDAAPIILRIEVKGLP